MVSVGRPGCADGTSEPGWRGDGRKGKGRSLWEVLGPEPGGRESEEAEALTGVSGGDRAGSARAAWARGRSLVTALRPGLRAQPLAGGAQAWRCHRGARAVCPDRPAPFSPAPRLPCLSREAEGKRGREAGRAVSTLPTAPPLVSSRLAQAGPDEAGHPGRPGRDQGRRLLQAEREKDPLLPRCAREAASRRGPLPLAQAGVTSESQEGPPPSAPLTARCRGPSCRRGSPPGVTAAAGASWGRGGLRGPGLVAGGPPLATSPGPGGPAGGLLWKSGHSSAGRRLFDLTL